MRQSKAFLERESFNIFIWVVIFLLLPYLKQKHWSLTANIKITIVQIYFKLNIS